MSKRHLLLILTGLVVVNVAIAQNFKQLDERGNISETGTSNRSRNSNFNPNKKDSTVQNKVVPKGIYAWTVDRKFGDIQRVDVDTLPHLYPQSTLATGRYGQYNTVGSNYTARLNRIFMDRQSVAVCLYRQLRPESAPARPMALHQHAVAHHQPELRQLW